MARPAEVDAIRHAIALSALGVGTASPNPPVGCVILARDGQMAGAGYHQRKGEPHAEVHALAAAGSRARGGTAVVTLEPCNHVGVTPACRQALMDAGIVRVVISLIDPTSRGDGGAAVLAAAGVHVEIGRRQNDAVMLPDGTIEEGIPGGHGTDRLRLPDAIPNHTDPSGSLNVLFEGGVRTLLVVGQSPIAQSLGAVAALDCVVAHVRRAPEASASITRPASMLPEGFQLVQLSTAPDIVRLFARRITQNASPPS